MQINYRIATLEDLKEIYTMVQCAYNRFGFIKVGHADWRKGRFYLMEEYLG